RDNQFGTNAEDAARRDFTLNALYYNPLTEEVIDYHHGVADLKKKVVRMIGDPETRYREDPVRMLRAVRFASKLDAHSDPAAFAPRSTRAHLIEAVPAARLVDGRVARLPSGDATECRQQRRGLGLPHQRRGGSDALV